MKLPNEGEKTTSRRCDAEAGAKNGANDGAKGLCRGLNPGPPAPKAGIIPLDHTDKGSLPVPRRGARILHF